MMGLFGGMKLPPMPGLISGYGGGTFNMDGTQATPMESAMAIPTGFGERPDGIEQAAAYAGPVKKGGLFGSGVKLQQIAGILGDALLSANGGGMPYTQMQMQQRQYDRALQQNALQQQQELARQMALKQWERANPAPTEAQRTYEWYRTLGDADRQLYAQLHPQYITADNGDGTKTVVPVTPQMFGGQNEAPPSAPVGKLRPMGGPSGNAGGNFLPGR